MKLCPASNEAKKSCESFGAPANTDALPDVTVTSQPTTFAAAAYTSCETVYPYRARVGRAEAGHTAT